MRTVACFGDSLIYGFPFGPRYSWLAQAEALTGHKFLNYGVCGDCCDDILERLRRMYLPTQTTHILFWGGANDIIQMRPLKFILEDLQKTLVYCQSSKLELGLVLPLLTAESGLNEYLLPLREAVSSNFAGKASLFDLQPAIGLGKKQLQAAYLDGVHPTAATYAVLGTYAAPLLDTWLSNYNCK
ncbi:GDSL-type esterase/lipase family protein [uncultured Phascolarctobacterium sp.]|uniref:SGNH/GDSL hydrolase family protein n=1 Tax=uncultured Phascolarctobacterium sp. TaxID=512296 RepID=UPI0015A95945|nr:GDSL-type esterase/lipase family protein [uncultured Phascolarctobacterium sp.]